MSFFEKFFGYFRYADSEGVLGLPEPYKDGLGEAKPENMTILGLDLREAEKIFSKAAYGKKDARLDKDKLKYIHGN